MPQLTAASLVPASNVLHVNVKSKRTNIARRAQRARTCAARRQREHVELLESTVRLVELNAATWTKAVAAYIEHTGPLMPCRAPQHDPYRDRTQCVERGET